MPKYPFETEIKMAAEKYELDPDLVAAFCFVESSFKPESERFELKFKEKYIDRNPKYENQHIEVRMALATSMGLMQVMGVVAHEYGLALDLLHYLFKPAIGLDYGCKKLAQLRDRYRAQGARYTDKIPDTLNLEPWTCDMIAAYNQGDARKGNKGGYANQGYVDKVLSQFNKYKKMGAKT